MAGLIAASLLASAFLCPCLAANPKTLGLKFEVERHQTESPTIDKRDKSLGGDISNRKIRYLTNITVGTPPQRLSVRLDTGSADLWIPSADSKMCQDFAETCFELGSFNTSQSWTHKVLEEEFEIIYGDCTGVVGNFTTDTVGIFGVSMDDVQMGLAFDGLNRSDMRQARGILGVGFESSESAVIRYPNLVSQLVLNGHINSRAYSIWLDDYDAATGNLLFGGVDTSKYIGDLQVLPIVDTAPAEDGMERVSIQMTSLTFEDVSGSSDRLPKDTMFRVLLDTGSTLTMLPQPVAEAMYRSAYVIFIGGLPFVRCTNVGTNFTFGFGGPDGAKITVPISEFMIPALSGEGFEITDGIPACRFGVGISGSPTDGILGDTFLRSAYAVFDLDNRQIALAQSNDIADVSAPPQIREITNGAGGIPGVSKTATMIPWPSSFLKGENEAVSEPALCWS